MLTYNKLHQFCKYIWSLDHPFAFQSMSTSMRVCYIEAIEGMPLKPVCTRMLTTLARTMYYWRDIVCIKLARHTARQGARQVRRAARPRLASSTRQTSPYHKQSFLQGGGGGSPRREDMRHLVDGGQTTGDHPQEQELGRLGTGAQKVHYIDTKI